MIKQQQKEQKSSYLVKRQQYHAQIRKSYLNEYFVEKRKMRTVILDKQIKQSNFIDFGKMLDEFITSNSKVEGQNLIEKIHEELCKENSDVNGLIKQFGQKMVKLFTMFPKNKNAMQILYIVLEEGYQHTFNKDDIVYSSLYGDNPFQVQLNLQQLTPYQQAVHVLLKTIDQEILKLGLRHSPLQSSSEEQAKLIIAHNKQIQRSLKIYLNCLKILSMKLYAYAIRLNYTSKYSTKWAKLLIIDFQFGIQSFIFYLLFTSRFYIPFQTLLSQKHKYKNNTNQQLNSNLTKIQDEIMEKIFSLCIPKTNQLKIERIPLISMLFIKDIFSFIQIKAEKIIQYLDKILYLVKVILNCQQYFKIHNILKIFNLLNSIIQRFIIQLKDVQSSLETKQKLRKINLVSELKNMQFLHTFDIYFKCGPNYLCIPLFSIVKSLIEYCMVYEINLDQLFKGTNILSYVLHGIDRDNVQVIKINLESIVYFCEYCEISRNKKYLLKMIDYKVELTLQNLAYHNSDWIKELAIGLLERYFTEQKIYEYTQLETENKRYQNQYQAINDWERKQMRDENYEHQI